MNQPDTILAAPLDRLAAAFFDLLAAGVINFMASFILAPIGLFWMGGIVSVFYLIFRDSLGFLNYQSIGKKIIRMRVVKITDDSPLTVVESLKRNFIFLPNLFSAFGFTFIYAVGGVTFLLLVFEIYKIYKSSEYRRLGD